jgi:predicted dehydrogenase
VLAFAATFLCNLQHNKRMANRELRFVALGAGFWAPYQLAAWNELPGARCVGIANRTEAKAHALARRFHIPNVNADPAQLLKATRPDFVDVITDPAAHRDSVELAASLGMPVICQKPLAPTYADAAAMTACCRQHRVPLLVHENWRWQRPIRDFKAVLQSKVIGDVFRARIDYLNSFPVFDNQPFLKQAERFILSDMGSHILDAARFLFGEPTSVYARTQRVHPDIRGEDVATVVMDGANGATVMCQLSYASRIEHDRFPETYIHAEGSLGAAELGPDFWIRVTTAAGTTSRRSTVPYYPWADARYAVVHASIVDCNADLLEALQSGRTAETAADDNLNTVRLVHAAYASAAQGRAVALKDFTSRH